MKPKHTLVFHENGPECSSAQLEPYTTKNTLIHYTVLFQSTDPLFSFTFVRRPGFFIIGYLTCHMNHRLFYYSSFY